MLIPNDMSLTKLCLDSSLFKAKLFVRRNDAHPAASSRYLSFRSDCSIAGAMLGRRLFGCRYDDVQRLLWLLPAFRSNAYRAVSS
jgi:hypothetical protein